jgi:hypothetical protein
MTFSTWFFKQKSGMKNNNNNNNIIVNGQATQCLLYFYYYSYFIQSFFRANSTNLYLNYEIFNEMIKAPLFMASAAAAVKVERSKNHSNAAVVFDSITSF